MNFDPIHWIAAGLLLTLLALGLWSWGTSQRLDVCQANHEAYRATAEANAATATLANERALSILSSRVNKLNGELTNAKNNLDKSYSDYDRLRRNPAPKGTASPSLSEASRSVTCDEAGKARLYRTLERIESGVLSRLARDRDDKIILLNTCLAYVQALPIEGGD